MDIATQVQTYFAEAADATDPAEAVPHTSAGNNVTPLIDGRRYFREIRTLLTSLGTGPNIKNQFFYTAGWWLHLSPAPGTITTGGVNQAGVPVSPTTRTALDTMPAFAIEDDKLGPYPLMSQLLAEKAAAGVDIRVLGWVNPALLLEKIASLPGAESYWTVVVGTLKSIDELRNRSVGAAKPMAKRVCALTAAHLFGAFHLKLVIAHDGTTPWAFTGGIDFVPNRVAGEMHPSPTENWHDMAVAVNGPGVQPFYDLFRNLWNEQLKRSTQRLLLNGKTVNSVEPATSPVPPRTLPTTGTGKHRVQVARTLPQFNYSSTFQKFATSSGSSTLSFVPNGSFEVRVAWRKAIARATEYIYIEDQSLWSQEVMDWINARLKANATVKVILLSGAPDPNDPPNDGPFVEAVNNNLLKTLSQTQKARVGLFVRKGIVIHSKVTLIDDHWFFAGSANCMRRSLFTDGELSVATLDENDVLAQTVRVDLWGGHFGKASGAPRASLKNLKNALGVWNPAWGGTPPYALPSARIDVRTLPLPTAVIPFDPEQYMLADADSRQLY
jgi:phosphatidylserine/phosphatidylglycerophosphate/cardiolipin synthase-like enzyme